MWSKCHLYWTRMNGSGNTGRTRACHRRAYSNLDAGQQSGAQQRPVFAPRAERPATPETIRFEFLIRVGISKANQPLILLKNSPFEAAIDLFPARWLAAGYRDNCPGTSGEEHINNCCCTY